MIGDILNMRCVWNDGGYVGHKQHDPKSDALDMDTMEYQIRNWSAFIWASGDHIVEQHVHNLDIAMWTLGDKRLPIMVRGMGGRSTDLPSPKYGDRFSHFAVDFDMGDGLRIASYCHQDDFTSREIGQTFYGTKGIAKPVYFGGGKCVILDRKGKVLYEAPTPKVQALIAEHKFLINAIKSGKHVNRLRPLVNSTLVAIAGRESAYSGKKFKYEAFLAKSKGTLYCEEKFGKLPIRSVPVPGKTPML
jgi:predicted dehydrogenase